MRYLIQYRILTSVAESYAQNYEVNNISTPKSTLQQIILHAIHQQITSINKSMIPKDNKERRKIILMVKEALRIVHPIRVRLTKANKNLYQGKLYFRHCQPSIAFNECSFFRFFGLFT